MRPQAWKPLAVATIPAPRGPSSRGSRLPCGQLVDKMQSRQKQRLGDIRVKVQ